MSFSSLPIELRHEIYSYLVFEAPQPPAEASIIQITRYSISGPCCYVYCREFPSPEEMYHHFTQNMIDPAQAYGSLIMDFGTGRPCLSTPRNKECNEAHMGIPEKCICEAHGRPQCHGPNRVHSLLMTSQWLAQEIRTWLYPQFVFSFHPGAHAAFSAFTANLLPPTRERVRALRLCIPIHSYKGFGTPAGADDLHYLDSDHAIIRHSNAWSRNMPHNIEHSFPSLRALYIDLWHFSRRPFHGCGLAAPIADSAWRREALDPILRFAVLPLEKVTVIVDNVWPNGDIWSGDPRIKDRRQLAEWLRGRLLKGREVKQGGDVQECGLLKE